MAYQNHNWFNVTDPKNPPENATALDKTTLEEIETGIINAHNMIEENKIIFENSLQGTFSGIYPSNGSRYIEEIPPEQSITISVPLENPDINRVNVYIDMGVYLILLYINKNSNSLRKGFRIWDGGTYASFGTQESFELLVDDNILLKSPCLNNDGVISFDLYNRSTKDSWNTYMKLCWENS